MRLPGRRPNSRLARHRTPPSRRGSTTVTEQRVSGPDGVGVLSLADRSGVFPYSDAAHDAQYSAAAIEVAPAGVVAFVGRCQKGPVNEPVSIGSFAEFQQTFGGLWDHSTLPAALEQFFEH